MKLIKEMKIEALMIDHPAKAYGFNYSVTTWCDHAYCGNGKYFRTREEAEEYMLAEVEHDRILTTQREEALKALKPQKAEQTVTVWITL